VTVFGMDDRSGKEGFKYVIIGEQYMKVFDIMQARFKNVKLIPWHDAPQFFCDLVNLVEGSDYKPLEIDNPDKYSKLHPSNLLPSDMGRLALGHKDQVPRSPNPSQDLPIIW